MPTYIHNSNAEEFLSYNNIEPRTRIQAFDVTVRGQVHDALWMLTQQYRAHEYKASDAGSPAFARLRVKKSKINKYKIGSQTNSYDHSLPMEAVAEKLPVRIDMGLRIEMGGQWLKQVSALVGTNSFNLAFVNQYPINTQPNTIEEVSNIKVMQVRQLTSRNIPDGYDMYQRFIQNPSENPAYFISPQPSTTQLSNFDQAKQAFVSWFKRSYYQPDSTNPSAWIPSSLEYNFKCAAPDNSSGTTETILTAEQYQQGTLEWHSFDLDTATTSLGTVSGITNEVSERTVTFIPSRIHLSALPKENWWEFEDSNKDIGKLKAQKKDLPKLSLMDFVLNYSNDWFLLPYKTEVGALYEIETMVVKDVFGDNILLNAAGSGEENNWQRWNMFTLNEKGDLNNIEADKRLLMPPRIAKNMEGVPVERVHFLRDEASNMVWAVEKIVPDGMMGGIDSKLAYNELMNYLEAQISEPVYSPTEADIKYKLNTSVPEYWIPFTPVSVTSGSRAVVLRRSSLYRVLRNEIPTNDLVKPRTDLLRKGLDETPKTTYDVNEEEIQRPGALVTTRFQRTRWYNGKVVTWLGRRKETGYGEGDSGLRFDTVRSKNIEDPNNTGPL